jgi:hypothetical protein
MTSLASFSDAIGIIGVSFVLTAFFLLNTNKLTALMLRYQLLNFFGSWMILFSLLYHWNLASVLIEIAWISISMIGIVRALSAKKMTPQYS